uniref:DET1- and DDB1-associated protein 1 n=1 Tax=Ciona savignyi TaxID=51511 RepID=H2ZQY5_CIOSA
MEDKGRILQNFPSFNTSNFTQFDPHTADKKKKKITVYLSTEDHGPQQVIKKDRSSILLRYLYQQLDKKKHEGMKHKINPEDSPKTGSNSPDDEPRRKILKPSHSRDDVTSTSSFSQKT